MIGKLLVGLAISSFSISCAAQVAPAATTHAPLSTSAGLGMSYWSGDWNGGIYRWGPSAFGTVTIWHDLSLIVDGHSMIVGGTPRFSNYKYFAGAGGLVLTTDYYGRFQPLFKGEIGYASLSHPPNGSGRLHQTGQIYSFGAGVEYHTLGKWWTRVEYTYDFFPNFHSAVTGQDHSLNPRGFTFGETYRFGPTGDQF